MLSSIKNGSNGKDSKQKEGSGTPKHHTIHPELKDYKDHIPAYRDFVIFEERLKYSLKLLKYRQRQYIAMLATLFCLISYFFWVVFISSLTDQFWVNTNKAMLFILCAVFLLILNSKNISQPKRFAPRINRTLKEYGIQFDPSAKALEVLKVGINPELKVDIKFREFFQDGLTKFRTLIQRKKHSSSTPSLGTSKSKTKT